jgi:hypothetical protein
MIHEPTASPPNLDFSPPRHRKPSDFQACRACNACQNKVLTKYPQVIYVPSNDHFTKLFNFVQFYLEAINGKYRHWNSARKQEFETVWLPDTAQRIINVWHNQHQPLPFKFAYLTKEKASALFNMNPNFEADITKRYQTICQTQLARKERKRKCTRNCTSPQGDDLEGQVLPSVSKRLKIFDAPEGSADKYLYNECDELLATVEQTTVEQTAYYASHSYPSYSPPGRVDPEAMKLMNF